MTSLAMSCIPDEHKRHGFVMDNNTMLKFMSGATHMLTTKSFQHKPKDLTVVYLTTIPPDGDRKTAIARMRAVYHGIHLTNTMVEQDDTSRAKHLLEEDELQEFEGPGKLYRIDLRSPTMLSKPLAVTAIGSDVRTKVPRGG